MASFETHIFMWNHRRRVIFKSLLVRLRVFEVKKYLKIFKSILYSNYLGCKQVHSNLRADTADYCPNAFYCSVEYCCVRYGHGRHPEGKVFICFRARLIHPTLRKNCTSSTASTSRTGEIGRIKSNAIINSWAQSIFHRFMIWERATFLKNFSL